MPPSKLQLAKKQITAFLDAADKRVFSRRDLSTVLSENRNKWDLAQVQRRMTSSNFSLKKHS